MDSFVTDVFEIGNRALGEDSAVMDFDGLSVAGGMPGDSFRTLRSIFATVTRRVFDRPRKICSRYASASKSSTAILYGYSGVNESVQPTLTFFALRPLPERRTKLKTCTEGVFT
jgi:hypothetical protein